MFLCHPTCTTCEKARQFLRAHNIPFEERDIREQRPTLQELKRWHKLSGLPLKKLFNTSGMAYRALGLTRKLPEMTGEAQLELLASDGMLVKRPVLVLENTALFGFREKAWAEALLKQSLPENAEGEENKCR